MDLFHKTTVLTTPAKPLKTKGFFAILNASPGEDVMNYAQKAFLYTATALTMFAQGCKKTDDPTPAPVNPVQKIDTIYNSNDIYPTVVKALFATSQTKDPANPLAFVFVTKEAGTIHGFRDIDKRPEDVLIPIGNGYNFSQVEAKNTSIENSPTKYLIGQINGLISVKAPDNHTFEYTAREFEGDKLKRVIISRNPMLQFVLKDTDFQSGQSSQPTGDLNMDTKKVIETFTANRNDLGLQLQHSNIKLINKTVGHTSVPGG